MFIHIYFYKQSFALRKSFSAFTVEAVIKVMNSEKSISREYCSLI